MTFNANKILWFLFFILIALHSYGQKELAQYLVTAANNNPMLKAKFNSYNASLERITQVGSLPDPSVSFGYFILPIETRNGAQQFKISARQMFPWKGILDDKEQIQSSIAKAKYEAFEQAKSQLFFDVKSSYFQLYYIKKSINITLENIEILNRFKRISLIKIEAGKASTLDEIRVNMELNKLKNVLDILNDKMIFYTVKFNNLLNVSNDNSIIVPDSLPVNKTTYTKASTMDSLLKVNHQLKQLDFLSESFAIKKQLGEKQSMPNISLGIDYSAISDNNNTTSGRDALLVKVGFSVPIYKKKYSSMVNEALLMQQSTEQKKENQINVLETLVEKAFKDYDDALRRVELYKKQSNLARRAIKLLEEEYANSSTNFEEIIRMNQQLINYSLQTEKAKTDLQVSIAFINYLIGH